MAGFILNILFVYLLFRIVWTLVKPRPVGNRERPGRNDRSIKRFEKKNSSISDADFEEIHET